MKVGVCIYNDKESYKDGQFCNEYMFDNSIPDEYSHFLNLIEMCLRKCKYIVLFQEDAEVQK